MKHIECSGITAELIHSPKRKTLGLIVRDGSVTVRAPRWATLTDIEQLIQNKQEWLHKHLQRQQSRARPEREFQNGETVYWLGEPRVLQIHHGRPAQVQLHNGILQLHCANPNNSASIKRTLEHWYKTEGELWLAARVAHFAPLLKVQPGAIKLRHYRSRWGSCSHSGDLQFNWLLLMAPPTVVDYVVIHELCHLRHFNHSPQFWAAVASIMPGYAQPRRWLKTQTHIHWPTGK